ncbi:MAG: hypothetical protein LUD00_00875 [Prevotellaceae bacterium]|nr:hypothetical protein [Prevotellaceae bacterium]
MKKIPTLFERKFENHIVTEILPNVTEGMEWVLNGEGIATVKWDGACRAVIDGEFYKRYDAKRGRKVPAGAIPCEDAPDPVTGHLPCWVKCDRQEPGDKWFWAAYDNYADEKPDGTYEALGPHFQTNPYHLEQDILKPHGKEVIEVERSFEGIRDYLANNYIEGIVFWKDGEPKCKIKRKDFGFPWKTDKR